ncbi:RNA 2'-phosphotransferase [Shouchella lehensis]|uniref:Probable RNA 2'-phosphotransferase n=1 Tax=Shouchella lehensis G1 TaxID=1246626 RepID=A0A060LWR6_9BACI|nr:RNA 2'-phosphotransferase [Shouchella lehensis]AIC92738.1 RNA 2'-phosphotransferase-like protein [Shouchella lehensis G1]RQW22355.1 RNA 2'-phosphotransferase [Bacillus sp. C1-1]
MSENELNKFLSLILRHKPEKVGLKLDENGYVNVNDLLEGMTKSGRNINFLMLEEIVRTDEKNRYRFNETKTMIRANQGHSTSIKIQMKECIPPNYLLHGTTVNVVEEIGEKGILKMKRHYVHLTEDARTAITVGKRRGDVVLIKVAAGQMHLDGFVFYLSDNHVWQTETVPSKYCEVLRANS